MHAQEGSLVVLCMHACVCICVCLFATTLVAGGDMQGSKALYKIFDFNTLGLKAQICDI